MVSVRSRADDSAAVAAHVSDEVIAAVEPFGDMARALAETGDAQVVLDRVVHLAVRHLDACEFAGITVVDNRAVSSPASSSDAARTIDEIQAETGQGPCLDAIRHEDVFTTGDVNHEERWPKFASRAHHETKVASILSLRLFVEGDTYGSLNLYSTQRHAFDDSDIALGNVFAAHAGVAMKSARSSTEVIALQHSMLPAALPEVSGVSIAVRYLPATIGTQVGGDWYDALRLPDGRLAVSIGDVTGHGSAAATVMGQLRNSLRAYTVEPHEPAVAVGLASELLTVVEPAAMATLCHGIIQVDSDDTVTLCWTSAGHPPPLVVAADGSTEFLTGRTGPPVGMALPDTFEQNTTTIDPGATIVFYTDGLVERRGESIDLGLARLLDVAAGDPGDVEQLCDHLIATLIGITRDDDTAIIAVRVNARPSTPRHPNT